MSDSTTILVLNLIVEEEFDYYATCNNGAKMCDDCSAGYGGVYIQSYTGSTYIMDRALSSFNHWTKLCLMMTAISFHLKPTLTATNNVLSSVDHRLELTVCQHMNILVHRIFNRDLGSYASWSVISNTLTIAIIMAMTAIFFMCFEIGRLVFAC